MSQEKRTLTRHMLNGLLPALLGADQQAQGLLNQNPPSGRKLSINPPDRSVPRRG